MADPANEIQQQELLDEIADEFLDRRRKGESPSLSEFIARHPELKEQIGELLETLRFVDSFREDSLGSDPRTLLVQTPLLNGDTIGNYQIHEPIGAGGMGTVFRATHQKLKRPVALKLLSAARLTEDGIARFEREMAAVGKLIHQNIVVAYDAGEENGSHFIAMELVDGADVGRLADAVGRLDVGSATEIVRQSAIGLQHAHNNQLIHRDVKPSNLMLDANGIVKILDLGLARLQTDSVQNEYTHSGLVMGTVDYMAPEQASDSRSADARSDVYGLGATLCKLLTGSAPYQGDKDGSIMSRLSAMATVDPIATQSRRPDLPAGLADFVDQMIKRDPEERIQTAEEVAAALASFASSESLPELLKTDLPPARALPLPRFSQTGGSRESRFSNSQSRRDTAAIGMKQTIAEPHPVGRSGESSPVGKRANGWMWWLAGLVALFAAAWFVMDRIKLETPHGTVVIETEGGETKVEILGDTASFIDPTDGKQVSVSIDVDQRLLTFEKEGFKATGRKFELGKRDQKISIHFEPKSDLAATSATQGPFVVAAFDNRQGFAYVFFSDGEYDKVQNKTNNTVHHLQTNFYWKHAMRFGRDSNVSACLTEDFHHSLLFFDDGYVAKYHNPSRIELDTKKTVLDLQGTGLEVEDICAAVGWTDGDRYVFFSSGKNGNCARFDSDMKLLESGTTEQFFPHLKAKAKQLSAARVDPTTKLAYFYFRDGSCQSFDPIENKTLAEFSAAENDWKVPNRYYSREEPAEQPIKSPDQEAVDWCFAHGMKELWLRPERKVISVTDPDEFSSRMLPPIGAAIDADAENSHRTLLTLKRYNRHGGYDKLDRLTIVSTTPLKQEFLDELMIPSLIILKLDCQISPEQLKTIPLRGIKQLSLTKVNDQLLAAACSRFPNLETLTIGGGELSAKAVNSIAGLKSLKSLEISEKSKAFRAAAEEFGKSNSNVRVVLIEPETE